LLYYKGRSLSQKEKTAKLIKIAVPVAIAVLLIGGLTWFLLGDFGHLYPGPSGPKSPSSSHIISSPEASKQTSTATSSKSHSSASEPPKASPATATHSSSTSSGGSSCSANSKCDGLGLIGDCCPSAAGVMLECCS
jgi:hypothetical protein